MKIAIVGGGSTYSPELVDGLARRASSLGLRTIALTDTNLERLRVVGGFVERLTKRLAPHVAVELCSERVVALTDAQFVVVQVRVGGQAARLEDERMGRAHGVIGQETTGVGGLAKALRTIPVLLEVADDVARHAPHSTLINFTNPVSIVTEALLGHGGVRVLGLCNIPISQRMELAAQLGVSPADVELDSVGLNHLSFVRAVRVRGKDVLPELIADVSKILRSGHRPANIPDLDFPAELVEALGMIPSDYLRYFFLQPETIAEQLSEPKLRAEQVMEIEAELLEQYANPELTEKPASLAKRGGAHYSHAALEIIEAIAGNTGARLVVDVQNGKTLAELPASACIEVPCRVDSTGAAPLPQAPLEPEIRGLIQHVKAYEELAVRAAHSRRRKDLYAAVFTHPLIHSASTASALADDLMQRLGW